MKKMTLLLCLLMTSVLLFAQKTETRKNEFTIKPHQFQLDLDIKNVFNGLSGATLILKKKIKSNAEGNKHHFLRFAGQFDSQFTDAKQTTNIGTTRSRNVLNIGLGLGFEKQVVHKRFVHYFGLDVILGYSNLADRISNQSDTRQYFNFNAGVNPFLGFKYFITDQFSLGLETGFRLQYFHRKVSDVRVNGIRVEYNNLRFLTLGFAF